MPKKCARQSIEESPAKARKTKKSSTPTSASVGRKKGSNEQKKDYQKKGKQSKDNSPTVFRCNLQPIVKLIDETRDSIPQTHFEAIMRTPFGSFFRALYEKKVNINHIDRITKPIRRIIKSYSSEQDGFLIAGKVLRLTADDVALTFGLPKVGKEVVLLPRTLLKASESKFVQRQFKDVKFMKKDTILAPRGSSRSKGYTRLFEREQGCVYTRG